MPETKATAGQCLGSGLTQNGSLGSDTSGNKRQRIQTHRDLSNNATLVSPCHTQWYIWTLTWQRRDSSNGIEEKDGGSQKAVERTRGTTASIRVVLS